MKNKLSNHEFEQFSTISSASVVKSGPDPVNFHSNSIAIKQIAPGASRSHRLTSDFKYSNFGFARAFGSTVMLRNQPLMKNILISWSKLVKFEPHEWECHKLMTVEEILKSPVTNHEVIEFEETLIQNHSSGCDYLDMIYLLMMIGRAIRLIT